MAKENWSVWFRNGLRLRWSYKPLREKFFNIRQDAYSQGSEEILNNWEAQSQGREFNAILTVAYKKRVIAYYDEFKKQMEAHKEKLNVAMTFSFGNENDPENIPPEIIKGMFKDYAEYTGIEFIAGIKSMVKTHILRML